jgi:hypothetical protein
MKRGKKTKAWDAARRKLKPFFENLGIDYCEMCGGRFGLSFAHSKKRRNIVGDEIKEVILICVHPCHENLERLPEVEMTEKVREIISNRSRIVTAI